MFSLEYLPDGSSDCPLIRLYGFETADVVALQSLCIALAEGRLHEAALDAQTWVHAIGDCRLLLRAGDANMGIKASGIQKSFVMVYSREGWLEVSERLTPFIAGTAGFQWLTNEGDVKLVISGVGLW